LSKLLVTAVELADLISVPAQTIRKLAREGRIPGYKPGNRQWIFDPEEVVDVIKRGASEKSEVNHEH